MAYTKTVWASGDTVTSAKLNKIENELESLSNGGAMGGSLLVTISEDESGGDRDVIYVIDKTYNEIVSAFSSGILPIGLRHEEETYDDSGSMMKTLITIYEYYEYCPFQGAWQEPYDNSAPLDNPVYSVCFKSNMQGGMMEFYSLSPNGQMTTAEVAPSSPKSAEPDSKSIPEETKG